MSALILASEALEANMLTKDMLVSQIQEHFWNKENWFSRLPRTNYFWNELCERIRSEPWIRFHLSLYPHLELKAAFPEHFDPTGVENPYDTAEADQTRSFLTAHLVDLMKPGTPDGDKVDLGVDDMACLHFNRGVLRTLAREQDSILIEPRVRQPLDRFYLRRTGRLREFELVLKLRSALHVYACGTYDENVNWLARKLTDAKARKRHV